ncbi:MAG: DUF4878 domain-containing protein [Paludibacteraceae bacterium]|nr:DUF4878 domain-containing protein [Paludibacteraceae bacterium]MBQ9296951.1 DUF4878 domain-containing protein [Paludibacteraceae bacterium]
MKKMIHLMSIVLIAMTFAACGSKNATPDGAMDAFLEIYQKGDYAAMVDQMHFSQTPTDEQKAQLTQMLEEKIGAQLAKQNGIASYKVGEVQMAEDGQSAVVNYTINFGDGTSKDDTQKMVLVDGKWMVDGGK